MTHLAHVAQPSHHHRHPVWVLPDSPLGRWTASLATGGALVVLACLAVGVVAVDGPWMFLLIGVALWAVAVAALAGLVAAVALVRDHALVLGAIAVMGLACAVLLTNQFIS